MRAWASLLPAVSELSRVSGLMRHYGYSCGCVMMPSPINLTTGILSSEVKYSGLSKSPPKIPYEAIVSAIVLFLIDTFFHKLPAAHGLY